MTLTVAVADLVPSVTEVAVMVTEAAAAGAVYVVAVPLPVLVGLNVPQEPLGAQLQVTPAFALSFVTVAVIEAVAFVTREVGAPLSATEMGFPPPPPVLLLPLLHATSAATPESAIIVETVFRNFIAHPP